MADPLGDNEMQRVCHGCVNPNKRNGSSAGSAAGAASSKRPCPEGEGTGKDADSSAGDKSQAVDTPRPPPYTKVASQFGDLEGEAEKCNMAEVSYHLRKAKLAWMREFGLRKRKQTIMADFL